MILNTKDKFQCKSKLVCNLVSVKIDKIYTHSGKRLRGSEITMMVCENCGKTFQWRTIAKSVFASFKPVECESCGITHKVSTLSHVVFASLIAFPIVFLGKLFEEIGSLSILFYAAWLGAAICITPLFVRYHMAVKPTEQQKEDDQIKKE